MYVYLYRRVPRAARRGGRARHADPAPDAGAKQLIIIINNRWAGRMGVQSYPVACVGPGSCCVKFAFICVIMVVSISL